DSYDARRPGRLRRGPGAHPADGVAALWREANRSGDVRRLLRAADRSWTACLLAAGSPSGGGGPDRLAPMGVSRGERAAAAELPTPSRCVVRTETSLLAECRRPVVKDRK